MSKLSNIYVFGCGGVGSWVAEYVARSGLSEVISLIDYDIVEEKNLTRQNYTKGDEGSTKANALLRRLKSLVTDSNDFEVLVYNRKILSAVDLVSFNKGDLAIIATDNVSSKRLIAGHFGRFLLVNCDQNFVEVKNHLDAKELNAWDMGGGYSNEQDLTANTFAALVIHKFIRDGRWTSERKWAYTTKIENDIDEKRLVTGR